MFGKDLNIDGMLMHSAEFCLPSPCYCPAAFAEQEGRQLLRCQDQPEQMLRRCSMQILLSKSMHHAMGQGLSSATFSS